MQGGVSIVPVFSFNENNLFDVFNTQNKYVNWFRKKFQAIFGLSLPLIKNIWPKTTDHTLVFGKPMKLPKIENPSDELLQQYLEKYIDSVKELYKEYSPKYSIPSTKTLEII